ncbi:MAG: AAA family ATPase [Methylococcaceae bacterium]|nr:AAA family ATPase [Methylococcaceae bacterium]
MSSHLQPLAPEQLFKPCDPNQFDFTTTEELADTSVIVGQERALDAIRVGMGIAQEGFNVFALGPTGSGKLTAVRESLAREAEQQPPPVDWCYVNNFESTAKPRALSMPCGEGSRFARDMDQLIEELSVSIPATFEGEEYRTRAEEIEEKAKLRELRAIDELRAKAKQMHISLVETPTSFAFAPVDGNHETMSPDHFEKLDEKQQHEIQENIAHLHQQLQKLLRQFPIWRKETKEKLKNLNREFAVYAVSHHVEALKSRYDRLPAVVDYMERVEQDIVLHVEDFFPKSEVNPVLLGQIVRSPPFQRYKVNLLVDHGGSKCAPIVVENLPNHGNLIGRIEHQALMGALVTDFSMIKPGALHLANGGYLILDARKLLMQPYAWESLKRVLQTGEIRIESLERTLSLISTASLEPEPIPLRVKIILIGDRFLYYLLSIYDSEFRDLFKISADFEETIGRDDNGMALYARVIASLARREGLKPLDRAAVMRVIEHSSRLAEDAEKLSSHLRSLNDLLKEADYWASQTKHKLIEQADVQTAIDHQIHRSDRVRERIYEAIRRGTILIEVKGEAVGRINGLSVISLGDFAFGQPSRITANTRLGSGKFIDIEREIELGGPLHSKGVMILSSFIACRYARNSPLSISASIVFEQSYGMVEGDSASLAELCAILSSLADLPIRQSLAVTGSVNQHGWVQPIGGVNEKIEGFFDVCQSLGLNGEQGVIIPVSNIKNLMLRRDVVEAVKSGKFFVYAVETVDQALELLMGKPAGMLDESGQFPFDSLNGLIDRRLRDMSELQKKWAQPEKQPE